MGHRWRATFLTALLPMALASSATQQLRDLHEKNQKKTFGTRINRTWSRTKFGAAARVLGLLKWGQLKKLRPFEDRLFFRVSLYLGLGTLTFIIPETKPLKKALNKHIVGYLAFTIALGVIGAITIEVVICGAIKRTRKYLKKKAFNVLVNNTKHASSASLAKIKACSKKTIEKIGRTDSALKTTIKKKIVAYYLGPTASATQSSRHAHKNLKHIHGFLAKELARNKRAHALFQQIHKKEKEEQAKGRYTFVHAQKWGWHLPADLFKKLWEIRYGEKIVDYQFLRFAPKSSDLTPEIEKRKRALAGTDGFNWYDEENSAKAARLFMNHAIFGNAGRSGCCSASYWLNNHDFSGGIEFSVKSLFELLNLEQYYEKYAKKFEQLKKLHAESSSYGNMLLLSFTPEQMQKCVIPADGSGNRNSAYVDNQETYNTKTILDALRDDPERVSNSNFVEYCLLLTHDCALDPHNGPRIYSFNAPDNRQFKKYKQLRDEIFKELAQDIAKARTQATAPCVA